VPGPAIVSLALLQLGVNIARHELRDEDGRLAVDGLSIRSAPGPTFHLEWEAETPRARPVRTHRHVRQRRGWGLGYARMAADALGATLLPPAPAGPHLARVSFGLGSRSLGLPLALLEGQQVTRASRAWHQEHQTQDEQSSWLDLAISARDRAGSVVASEFYSARAVPKSKRVWLAMPPESGIDRVRDVLRGLDHERVLLTAPEPHATRLHALNLVLRYALGEDLVTTNATAWAESFASACRALGLARPQLPNLVLYPDPQLTAWLLAEVGGELVAGGSGAPLLRAKHPTRDPRLRLLRPDRQGLIQLTPDLS
jgi:hypothetical protein